MREPDMDTVHQVFREMSYQGESKKFADEFKGEHRTNQQSILQVCFAIIERAARMADDGDMDLRNEAGLKRAQKLRDLMPDLNDKMPYI